MASVLKVDKLDPQSGTALEIGTSGDTISVPSGATLDISASTLTPPATMPASSAANLTSIPAANLTGTIAAISGANLTNLTATNLSSGTVPTARLGSGTASSSTVLYGDQTYKAEPGGGKIIQVVQNTTTTATSWADSSALTLLTDINVVITPTASDSKIFVMMETGGMITSVTASLTMIMIRDIAGGTTDAQIRYQNRYVYSNMVTGWEACPLFCSLLDDPSTTSECTYYFKMKCEDPGSVMANANGGTRSAIVIAWEVGA